MFLNQKPTSSNLNSGVTLSYRSRKRTRELEREPKSRSQRECCYDSTWDAVDLISLFNELTLFDDRIERINVKDMICQEFTDRIGKLYKPIVMEQDWTASQISSVAEKIDVTKNLKYMNEYISTTKDDCPMYIFNSGFKELQGSKKILIDYGITSYLQDNMFILKYCSEDLRPPFRSFEDFVLGLAAIYLGKTFMNNENLNTLRNYINAISKKTIRNISYDGDCGSDFDNCFDNCNVQKRKRRKVMSDYSTPIDYDL